MILSKLGAPFRRRARLSVDDLLVLEKLATWNMDAAKNTVQSTEKGGGLSFRRADVAQRISSGSLMTITLPDARSVGRCAREHADQPGLR